MPYISHGYLSRHYTTIAIELYTYYVELFMIFGLNNTTEINRRNLLAFIMESLLPTVIVNY